MPLEISEIGVRTNVEQSSATSSLEVKMFYDATVTQFTKMLHNMANVLDKTARSAADRNFEVAVLLDSQLAPDQFNFTRQIQILCDTAKSGVGLLAGKEKDIPAHEDTEKTLNELKLRIENVIAYLNSFSKSDFDDAAQRQIFRPRWEGKHLFGEEFLLQHVIPNFYFHFTTAYAILRHNGVTVGKKDYLGELPYKK